MEDKTDYNALFGTGKPEAEEGVKEEERTDSDRAAESVESAAHGGAGRAHEERTPETIEAAADGGEKKTVASERKEPEAAQRTPRQSAEENARYAAARRKAEAERDLAVRKAREDAMAEIRAELSELLGKLGSPGGVHPETVRPETSEGDKPAARGEAFAEESRTGASAAASVPPAAEQPRSGGAAGSGDPARVLRELDRQMAEIAAIDPTVRTLDDLRRMENYPRFRELVRRGNTLADAFRLASLDRRDRAAGSAFSPRINASGAAMAAQAKQAALNQINSKAHLDRTTTRGAGAAVVPADVAAQYRAINPEATEAEIRAHWAKYKKISKR